MATKRIRVNKSFVREMEMKAKEMEKQGIELPKVGKIGFVSNFVKPTFKMNMDLNGKPLKKKKRRGVFDDSSLF